MRNTRLALLGGVASAVLLATACAALTSWTRAPFKVRAAAA